MAALRNSMFYVRSALDRILFTTTLTVVSMLLAAVVLELVPHTDLSPLAFWTVLAIAAIQTSLGSYVALTFAMKRNRKNARLRWLLDHDQLTGVHSRRYFFDAMNARPAYSRGALMIADVDHFKAINDTHGHAVGDLVLAKLAETLQSAAPAGGIVARFGGEEFVIFVETPELGTATWAGEEIRQAVEARSFRENGTDVSVTVSIGLGMLYGDEDVDPVLRDVDAALYRAKASGRNRVVASRTDHAMSHTG